MGGVARATIGAIRRVRMHLHLGRLSTGVDRHGCRGIGNVVARYDARGMVEQFAAGWRADGYRSRIGIPAQYHHHVLLPKSDGGLWLHGARGIHHGQDHAPHRFAR